MDKIHDLSELSLDDPSTEIKRPSEPSLKPIYHPTTENSQINSSVDRPPTEIQPPPEPLLKSIDLPAMEESQSDHINPSPENPSTEAMSSNSSLKPVESQTDELKPSLGNLSTNMQQSLEFLLKTIDPKNAILLGGTYMNYLGHGRTTLDIDVVLPSSQFDTIYAYLRSQEGFILNQGGQLSFARSESGEVGLDLLKESNFPKGLPFESLLKYTVAPTDLHGMHVPLLEVMLAIKVKCLVGRDGPKATTDLNDARWLAQLVHKKGLSMPPELKQWISFSVNHLIFIKEQCSAEDWETFQAAGLRSLHNPDKDDPDMMEFDAESFTEGDVDRLVEWLWTTDGCL